MLVTAALSIAGWEVIKWYLRRRRARKALGGTPSHKLLR